MTYSYIIALGSLGIGLLSFCFGMYRITNGRLSSKVGRDACHTAQKSVHKRIDDLDKHLDTRFDDIKCFIEKNGQA